jgi:hypothetical protein
MYASCNRCGDVHEQEEPKKKKHLQTVDKKNQKKHVLVSENLAQQLAHKAHVLGHDRDAFPVIQQK